MAAPDYHKLLLTRHFLHSESSAPRLRVGVMLDDDQLINPLADVLEHIRHCNFADLVLRIYNREVCAKVPAPSRSLPRRMIRVLDASHRKNLWWTVYEQLDARFASAERRRLASRDLSTLLAGVPRIDVTPISRGFIHHFSEETLETIRAYDLDLILRFGFNIIRGEILNIPRHGIWSYHHGDNDFYRGGPPHFWELAEGHPLSGVVLQILTSDLDAGTVLCKGLAPTENTIWWSKNCIQPYLLGTTFVLRKMFELHNGGFAELQEKAVPSVPYGGKQKIYRQPTNRQVASFLLPRLAGKALRRPFRRPKIDHWRIAFRSGQSIQFENQVPADLAGFRWCEAPRGRFYADPFLWESGDRIFCFFEDYDYSSGRGRISCGEVTAECSLTDVRPVLEPNYHLSFPYIFEDAGSIFLIPESAANGTVDLYRATAFPHKWEHVARLLDVPGLDTVILPRDGLYWMFTTVCEPRGASGQLVLLSSPTLTGTYQLHRQTPITADARFARSAGRIFEYNGALIRPSQDASGTYGSAIHLRRVTDLTPELYCEEPFADIAPPQGFRGLHSYDRAKGLEVIDGKRWELARRVLAAKP